MRLRELNIGCFGGGTGLPSLLGGLKSNPWLNLNAVVTMFDSGGSSVQLRDELGVLPPGDVLKCALALARNAREARRVLLARLPTLEHQRLGGHTGGNLLLSMMQRYSGDFLDAIDGLRALLGCAGRVWPVSVQQASVCAEYGDGSVTRGEVEVDAGQSSGRLVRKIWLEPPVSIHPAVHTAITEFDAVIIGPGSFYTSLMPIFLVRGVADALAQMKGPIVLIANLLTEGRGMGKDHEPVDELARADGISFICPGCNFFKGRQVGHHRVLIWRERTQVLPARRAKIVGVGVDDLSLDQILSHDCGTKFAIVAGELTLGP